MTKPTPESAADSASDNHPATNTHDNQLISESLADSYWKANLKLLGILLSIWAIVSFGCGILFVDFLNQYSFFGFKLGFWFAQQGSILVFVVLIAIYTQQMHRLERRYGVDDDSE